MPLEDHIGDVCRKARLQTGIPIKDTSSASGLTESQLQEWETEGVIEVPVNVSALAEGLGLDAAKALRVAAGWVPAPVELGRWRELRMVTTVEGFEVNSFVIF